MICLLIKRPFKDITVVVVSSLNQHLHLRIYLHEKNEVSFGLPQSFCGFQNCHRSLAAGLVDLVHKLPHVETLVTHKGEVNQVVAKQKYTGFR